MTWRERLSGNGQSGSVYAVNDVFRTIVNHADAGIAVIVLGSVLTLLVLGYLVTERHLSDWRDFAKKQEERANAAEAALRDQTERDERLYAIITELRQIIITAIARDRS